jgi:hypothetical protein
MAWTVRVHPEVAAWQATLDGDTFQQVVAAVRMLAEQGPVLPRPLADTVRGSRHHNMKELRPGSAGRSEVRILFAFDPWREAVLLAAGDKAGQWEKWYRDSIPVADARFDEHIERRRREIKNTGG